MSLDKLNLYLLYVFNCIGQMCKKYVGKNIEISNKQNKDNDR